MSELLGGPIAVIGAGSWGTGLAWLLSHHGPAVRLWCRRPELAAEIGRSARNQVYLPSAVLPRWVTPTADLAEACAGAAMVVVAVPSVGMAAVAAQLAQVVAPGTPVISATKGLDHTTAQRMTVTLAAALGPEQPVAALSGPNLADEVVAGKPAVAVVAHGDCALRRALQAALSRPLFRVYTNPDVAGVELGGALKNPLAIAAGIVDGLGLGDNTKAALMTRGIHEVARLGVALGADERTFAGLCGFGDLLATCHSRHSRNRSLGERLGRGESVTAIQASSPEVVEGVPTTKTALRLAREQGVEMPILTQLHAVIFEGLPIRAGVSALLARDSIEEY
ncbi:MAG TPA: glycerol-3-phosphate dehydrogenase [Armatimonadetes bacterium]|nr:glycerol-3-phosphate dehydrogenase [Armatimonadota bacterium]